MTLVLLSLRRTCATHFGQQTNTKDTLVQMRHSDPALRAEARG